jgi:6-phosphogluconolactonase
MSGRLNVEIRSDVESLARTVAEWLRDWASDAVTQRGRFTIAMAGGSTPKSLYQLLASYEYRDALPWAQTIAFWGDERYVPQDHEDSNYRMTREALLDHVPIPESNVYPVPTHLEPPDAASTYEAQIREVFGTLAPEVPVFDVILLGIGADGHTASLFPHTEALDVDHHLVVENWVPQQNAMRITFTIPVLHEARHVVLMAAGVEKAEAIARAVEGEQNLAETPSQCLRDARGNTIFLIDHSAATHLD